MPGFLPIEIRAPRTTWIEKSAGIISIVGMIATIIFGAVALFTDLLPSELKEIIPLTIISCFFTISMGISIFYAIKLHSSYIELGKSQYLERLLPTEKEIHSFLVIRIRNMVRQTFNLSKYIEDKISTIQSGEKLDITSIETIRSSVRMHMLALLDNCKMEIDTLNRDHNSCCIKIIDINNDGNNEGIEKKHIFVRTLFRDSISFGERKLADDKMPVYNYYDNTAFYRILSNKFEDLDFISNDLNQENDYRNLNVKWQNFYKATAVVPIWDKQLKGYDGFIGFLCVDNKKGGYDREVVLPYLEIFSDLFLCMMRSYYEFEELLHDEAGNVGGDDSNGDGRSAALAPKIGRRKRSDTKK